jgi:hypothetical protein
LVTCPEVWDNSSKGLLIPHVIMRVRGLMIKGVIRFGRDLRPISSLVGLWPTKATTGRGPERVAPHTGTEIRARHLRVAAVGNIAQWAKA